MSTRFFLILISLFPAFYSCDNRQQVNTLQQETEQIHDDAMKVMADMNRLARKLKKELASLDSLPSPTLRRDSIIEALAAMDKAEADMMAWMAQYKAPEDQPNDLAMRYLQEQKQKITQNRDDLRAAVALGSR